MTNLSEDQLSLLKTGLGICANSTITFTSDSCVDDCIKQHEEYYCNEECTLTCDFNFLNYCADGGSCYDNDILTALGDCSDYFMDCLTFYSGIAN